MSFQFSVGPLGPHQRQCFTKSLRLVQSRCAVDVLVCILAQAEVRSARMAACASAPTGARRCFNSVTVNGSESRARRLQPRVNGSRWLSLMPALVLLLLPSLKLEQRVDSCGPLHWGSEALTSPQLGVSALVSPGERRGLVNLYLATNDGPGWSPSGLAGWRSYANASVDPCKPVAWAGVSCDSNGTSVT
jgi:hypothetical protein